MPDSPKSIVKLEDVLNYCKWTDLNVNSCERIKQALKTDNNIQIPIIEELLQLCIPHLQKDSKNMINALNVITMVLEKVKSGLISSAPNLLPSAIAVLNATKTTAYCNKEGSLKFLCFETLQFYPDDVYVEITDNYLEELLELFNLYCHQRIPAELRVQPINLLHKLLIVLPPDKKAKLANDGINLWFMKVIPAIMSLSTTPNFKRWSYLETLEMLTNEVIHVDYTDNPSWQNVLECICSPEKYPAAMKCLLERGSDIWYKLWIIFIKLLKTQITKNNSNVGSPINAMLPVVELAFKMDVANRCRAFQCWNVLIDNFSTESNVFYLKKRIKLLVIPLCSNNAKTEETVLAKLDTWWHLILKFHIKFPGFNETILLPFLHFCFGKSITNNKPVFIPGLISDKTKKQCIDAFVNILGHHQCDGCVFLPRIENNIMNTSILIDHWKDWLNSLRVTIKIYADSCIYADILRPALKCAWITFVNIIANLPENNVRRDVFNDLLIMVLDLTKECQADKLSDIILSDFIPSLVNTDDTKKLLKSKDEQGSPVHKILSIVLNPSFDRIYDRYNLNNAVTKLMTFANYIVDQCLHTSNHIIEYLLKDLSPKYNSLVLWTALTASVCELHYDKCPRMLCRILMWPLKQMDLFTNVEVSTSQWLTLYTLANEKFSTLPINEDLRKILMEYENINPTNSSFLLKVSIMLLKTNLKGDNVGNCIKDIQLLHHIISKMHGMNHTDHTVALMDILPEVFRKLSDNVNLCVANELLSIVKVLFTQLLPEFRNSSQVDSTLVLKFGQLLTSIETLLKIEAYSTLKQSISKEFIECAPYFAQEQSLKGAVIGSLQILLNGIDVSKLSGSILKNVTELMEQEKKPEVKETFTTPGKLNTKKAKKMETSIVDTVLENGEEFVVVKSNWKFNPKKLTDNQKEKFQRKREDIPALYQDLSQSQDEFKLHTWKTDSVDTTTSTSNSKSIGESKSADVAIILNNINSTDIVPTIMKNISDKHEENNSKNSVSNEIVNNNATPKPNGTKSPKLAIKDRVFRNVRNLIEKSSVQNDGKDVIVNDVTMTPTATKTKNFNSVINSAPTDLNSDRPSRLKRKPKKFDDVQLFSLKKRRNSLSSNDSQQSDSVDNVLNDGHDLPENSCIKEDKPSTSTLISIPDKKDKSEVNIHNLDTTLAIDCNKHLTDKDQEIDNSLLDSNKSSEKNIDNIDSLKMDVITDKPINCPNILPVTNNECTTKNDDNQPAQQECLDTKSSIKKPGKRKSRIEKELAIDMVEGHPFLKAQSEERFTRNRTCNSPNFTKRSSLTKKLNKSKTDKKDTPKTDKILKDKEIALGNQKQDNTLVNSEDASASQDIIESSQDSTVSIMSIKTPINVKRIPIVTLTNITIPTNCSDTGQFKINLNKADNKVMVDALSTTTASNDDTEISRNKTAVDEVEVDLSAIADTEPMESVISDEIIIINDDEESPEVINTDSSLIEPHMQNTAEANTQPLDLETFIKSEHANDTTSMETQSLDAEIIEEQVTESIADNDEGSIMPTHDENSKSVLESLDLCAVQNNETSSSPFKDEEQRKQDFLNNTLEISPIKILSPVREKKSPSPETSSDFVIITLSSPVQSNGEPFEKCDSPEIFTEDKVSPDKRDQSPPREIATPSSISPRSLSLKKNKPQVRAGGRGAQMLGLCVSVSDRIQTIKNTEKSVESEESKKCSPINTAARRNLRILYNTTNENSETSEENEDNENFLKLRRSLPAADSSPAVTILKRKYDMIDEIAVSPPSKRKRVSFHDPPVSTTICVKKYIEPSGVRSPQSSALKRQEKPIRSQLTLNLKSQRRLDTAFKLDSALTKAVESFAQVELPPDTNEDTEVSSLEDTPSVDIVKTSELNDMDPICLDLINCGDPIDNIAGELSSPSMKPLLIKEFAGKIESVGDIARLTELEVNRLCIKAPKVQVAKKVLLEYMKKINEEVITKENEMVTDEQSVAEDIVVECNVLDKECQNQDDDAAAVNQVVTSNIETQTELIDTSLVSTQTDSMPSVYCFVQTEETGSKSVADIVKSLVEKPDFCQCLNTELDDASKQSIAKSLPLNAIMDTFMQKMSIKESSSVLDKILAQQTSDSLSGNSDNLGLSFIRDYLCNRFNAKDLMLFCSDLLKVVHDKNL